MTKLNASHREGNNDEGLSKEGEERMIKRDLKWFVGLAVFFMLLSWSTTGIAGEIVIGFTGPLSGPAAEYGQDCVYGVDMAIKEINAAGGVTVKGDKYTFRLEKLDDRVDLIQAKNNTMRFVSQYKAPVVFNPIATTLGAIMSIPQTPGQEFVIGAYSSIHTLLDKGHPMIICDVPNFTTYVKLFSDWAYDVKGWKRAAMVVTAGAYGDAWRKVFHHAWAGKGGQLVGDFPANYYTETDFSSQLTAALAAKPDVMLIGGPSSTTGLVIEQARDMGYKGGFLIIDQAKMDYIDKVLKNTKLLDNAMGVARVVDQPTPTMPAFARKYKEAYKRDVTWECLLNYNMMQVIAKSIEAGNSYAAKDIRRNLAKVLPVLGDQVPNELFTIDERGLMESGAYTQIIEDGKFSKPQYNFTWPQNRQEFNKYKKMSKTLAPERIRWVKIQ